MKALKSSPAMKVFIYFMVLGLAMFAASIVPVLSDFWFFMLVSVVASWFLLRSEGQTLNSVRLLPQKPAHFRQLAWGAAAGCTLLLITAAITLLITGDDWHFNTSVNPVYIFMVFLGCLWSSVVQEFVFRGYPFQTLLRHYGPVTAQIIVLLPFTFMHIHAGMTFPQILTTLLTTGLGSILFGLAYIRTKHLALPIGMHLGWNFSQALIPRAAGSTGNTLIAVSGDAAHYTFFNVVVPYVTVMLSAIAIFLIQSRTQKATGLV